MNTLSRTIDISFIGQVPVKIIGKVEPGDFVLPSGNNDGTGIAIPRSDITLQQYINSAGVILNKYTIPKNVKQRMKPIHQEMLDKAANSDYELYLVAVGVK